jgi:OmpA-OmpF porin, OOP family
MMTPRRALMATGLLVAAATVSPRLAMAQPVTGVYVGAGAGYNYQPSQKLVGAPNGFSGSRAFYSGSFAGTGSVGYGLGNGFRIEAEGVYLRATDKQMKPGFYGPKLDFSGRTQTYGAFLNALFDIDIGLPYLFPYIGGGAGYLWTERDDSTFGDEALHGTAGSFAYQGIAGLSLPIPPVIGLSLTAEYHYIGTTASEVYGGHGATQGADFKFGPGANQLALLGLRYEFNVPYPPAPAPVPVAAPAPAPARTYLVFFDWDRYDLTPRAKAVVAEAAANSTHVQYTRIEVNGYTDTSGTATYNQGLSIRRAKSVQAQLIADGVPANAISIMGYGETHLLVATGPGVREPQNRRVEIIIK